MKRTIYQAAALPLAAAVWLMAQPAGGGVDGFSTVEVASVSDAMEQLYGQRAYMSHEMRPRSAAGATAQRLCSTPPVLCIRGGCKNCTTST